jgi:hypothetical protein
MQRQGSTFRPARWVAPHQAAWAFTGRTLKLPVSIYTFAMTSLN